MSGGQRGRAPWRGPVAGLRDVAEFLADEERASVFLRGLTVGALVGAAIAGSQIWRRHGRRVAAQPAHELAPAESPAAETPVAESTPRTPANEATPPAPSPEGRS